MLRLCHQLLDNICNFSFICSALVASRNGDLPQILRISQPIDDNSARQLAWIHHSRACVYKEEYSARLIAYSCCRYLLGAFAWCVPNQTPRIKPKLRLALFLSAPYGVLADTYGQKLVYFLGILGVVLSYVWYLIVCECRLSLNDYIHRY